MNSIVATMNITSCIVIGNDNVMTKPAKNTAYTHTNPHAEPHISNNYKTLVTTFT